MEVKEKGLKQSVAISFQRVEDAGGDRWQSGWVSESLVVC